MRQNDFVFRVKLAFQFVTHQDLFLAVKVGRYFHIQFFPVSLIERALPPNDRKHFVQ